MERNYVCILTTTCAMTLTSWHDTGWPLQEHWHEDKTASAERPSQGGWSATTDKDAVTVMRVASCAWHGQYHCTSMHCSPLTRPLALALVRTTRRQLGMRLAYAMACTCDGVHACVHIQCACVYPCLAVCKQLSMMIHINKYALAMPLS